MRERWEKINAFLQDYLALAFGGVFVAMFWFLMNYINIIDRVSATEVKAEMGVRTLQVVNRIEAKLNLVVINQARIEEKVSNLEKR